MKKNRILHFDDERFDTSAIAESLIFWGWDVTFVSEIEDLSL